MLEHIHFPALPEGRPAAPRQAGHVLTAAQGGPGTGFIEEAVRHCHSLEARPVLQTKRTALCTSEEHSMFLGGGVFEQFQKHGDNTCYLGAKSKQWGKETPCWPCRAAAVLLCWAGFTFIAGGIFSRDTGGDTVSNLLCRCDRHYSRGSRWLP